MKISALLLLPLAVSAAVVRPGYEGTATSKQVTPVRRQAPAATTAASSSWLPSLQQMSDLIGSAYKTYKDLTANANDLSAKLSGALPDLLYAGVNNVAWYMSWTAKPVSMTPTAPVIDKTALKKVIKYGPFVLLGSKYNRTATPITMDAKADIIIRTLKGIPENAALLSGRLDTVLEDGSKADVSKGIYIHHLLIADVGKTSAPFALCPGGHNQKGFVPWISSHIVESIGAGLIQAGNDQVASPTIYASPNGPLKSGFLTGFDDTFLLEAEIVNYNPENTTIYLSLETEYLPDIPTSYLDASTLIFSATGCSSPGYRPPGNSPKYNFSSDIFSMNRDGYLLNMRGHLHDGGTSIQMFLNDQMVCESFPKYENIPGAKKPDGTSWQTITEMSYCDKPVKFKKGDPVKLVSLYDTTVHPLREGSTGEGGHVEGGHDAMAGMDMAEEMGIFTVNIASEKQARLPPGPKAPAPIPQAPAGPPPPLPSSSMAAMPKGGHSHGGRSLKEMQSKWRLNDIPAAPYEVV